MVGHSLAVQRSALIASAQMRFYHVCTLAAAGCCITVKASQNADDHQYYSLQFVSPLLFCLHFGLWSATVVYSLTQATVLICAKMVCTSISLGSWLSDAIGHMLINSFDSQASYTQADNDMMPGLQESLC